MVYSRKGVLRGGRDQAIIPACGQPEALRNGHSNTSGNPSFVPSSSPITDLNLPLQLDSRKENSTPKPILEPAPVIPEQNLDLYLPIAHRKGPEPVPNILLPNIFPIKTFLTIIEHSLQTFQSLLCLEIFRKHLVTRIGG